VVEVEAGREQLDFREFRARQESQEQKVMMDNQEKREIRA
jgi:hypothetical protein